eukprot:TRINITY_DN3916_c0_g1_i1.p1 TRINITY_DN3916_c0_g1~~TRINITY_DN3916_c0_g1_i1.p1  ORF type:complete len:542 (+),score=112.01 TRINITY_DN3916_c0_g1_i1:176-1627(+)
MREADRIREMQELNQTAQRKNTEAKLSHRSVQVALVTVVIALASVTPLLLFSEALTRTISTFALQLLDVSVMKVDTVGEGRSVIEEVDAMYVAMSLVVRNLTEYRQYLPQTLLVASDGEEEAENNDEAEQSPPLASRGNFTGADDCVSNSSLRGSSQSSGQQAATSTVPHCTGALQHRTASLGVINVVGYRRFVRENGERAVAAFHDEYLQEISAKATSSKGIVDLFVGDRVSLSFNAMRQCGQHRSVAVNVMLYLTVECPVARTTSLSGGAATGSALCGSLGTQGMRRFSVIGNVATVAALYERVCVQHGAVLLVDDSLRVDTEERYCYRLLECVIFPKLTQRPLFMYAIRSSVCGTRASDVDADEWMYCLSQRQRRARLLNPWARYNEAQRARWRGAGIDSVLRELDGEDTGQQAGADELRRRDECEQELRELVQSAESDPTVLLPRAVAEVGVPLIKRIAAARQQSQSAPGRPAWGVEES